MFHAGADIYDTNSTVRQYCLNVKSLLNHEYCASPANTICNIG